MNRVIPRQAVPKLSVKKLDNSDWQLSQQTPKNFSMVLVYRGMHCPMCKAQLRQLDRDIAEFDKRGVNVIAISSDTEERAKQTYADWGLENLQLGYDLGLEQARDWGLYLSTSRGKTSLGIEEPAKFVEPGLFLIRPDQTLYAAIIHTMPFARPHFDEVLKAIDFILDKDYPARGEA